MKRSDRLDALAFLHGFRSRGVKKLNVARIPLSPHNFHVHIDGIIVAYFERSVSMAAPHGQAQLLATPSGSHPQAATPTQAPEKGKSKAKSKAATGVQPSPAAAGTAVAGGSIGVAGTDPHPPGGLTAGGGARRPLPELVLPFPLPVSRSRGSCPTKEGKEDKGQGRQPSSVGRSQKGSPHDAPAVRKGRGNLASKGVSSEEEEEEGEEEDDSEDMSEDEDEEAALAREEERRRKKVPASIEKR